MTPQSERDELRKVAEETLVARFKEAVTAYNKLPPVEKALHDDEQRRSFVRGQCGRDPGPSVLAEAVHSLRASRDRLAEENARLREELDRARRANIRGVPIAHQALDDFHRAVEEFVALAQAPQPAEGEGR